MPNAEYNCAERRTESRLCRHTQSAEQRADCTHRVPNRDQIAHTQSAEHRADCVDTLRIEIYTLNLRTETREHIVSIHFEHRYTLRTRYTSNRDIHFEHMSLNCLLRNHHQHYRWMNLKGLRHISKRALRIMLATEETITNKQPYNFKSSCPRTRTRMQTSPNSTGNDGEPSVGQHRRSRSHSLTDLALYSIVSMYHFHLCTSAIIHTHTDWHT